MAATHASPRAVRGRFALACSIASLVAATLPGCAGRHAEATEPHGAHDADQERHTHTHAHDIDINAAALPFAILDARGGQQIATEQFFDALARADAICVGESHPNPHHHWAQLHVLEKLGELGQPGEPGEGGTTLALGMEMFQRPFQGVLDDFAAGRISEADLLSRTGWKERWGYDFAFYRPIVRLAVDRGMALLALNVAKELRKKLARVGAEGLSPDERGRLPEMKLDDAAHKAWFDGVMAEMGDAHGAHGSNDDDDEDDEERTARARRIYAAQVLWDETMADTAARWLAAGPGRRVVILAGSGHCHDSAIVSRLRRRGVAQVVSITPVVDDGEGSVAAELAEPITDYLFVMSPE